MKDRCSCGADHWIERNDGKYFCHDCASIFKVKLKDKIRNYVIQEIKDWPDDLYHKEFIECATRTGFRQILLGLWILFVIVIFMLAMIK